MLDDTRADIDNKVLEFAPLSDDEVRLDVNNALVELGAAKARHAVAIMNIAKAKLERTKAKARASRARKSSASRASNRSGRTRSSRAPSDNGNIDPDPVLDAPASSSNAAASAMAPPTAEQPLSRLNAVVSANIGGGPALSGHAGVGGPAPIQNHDLSLSAPVSSSPPVTDLSSLLGDIALGQNQGSGNGQVPANRDFLTSNTRTPTDDSHRAAHYDEPEQ